MDIIFDSEDPEHIDRIRGIRDNNPDAIIVFATGCMDIHQAGHAIFTEQLRSVGEDVALGLEGGVPRKVIVVYGLGRDSTIEKLKRKAINPQMNRAYSVASLKEVDFVIINGTEIGEGKVDFGRVLELLRPNVFVLNEDDSAIEIKKGLCERSGIIFKTVKRVVPKGITPTSTTEIVNRIREMGL